MFPAICILLAAATAETPAFEHHAFLYPDVFALRADAAEGAMGSLQAPMLAHNHYWHTGDRAAAEENIQSLSAFFKWLQQFKSDSGLITIPSRLWQTTWPPSLVNDLGRTAHAASPDPMVNAFYIRALRTTAALRRDLGITAIAYDNAAQRAHTAYIETFGAALRGAGETAPASAAERAVALAFNLVPPAEQAAVLAHLRASGPPRDPYLAGFAIDAALQADDPALAKSWMASDALKPWRALIDAGGVNTHPMSVVEPASPVYLVADRVFGLAPARPGWTAIRHTTARATPTTPYALPVPAGRVSIRPHPVAGVTVTLPPGVIVASDNPGVTVVNAMSHVRTTLTDAQQQLLAAHDWVKWASGKPVAWVSVAEQMLRVIEDDEIIYQARCATASKGVGNQMNSEQTPLGWHTVGKKLGDGAPWGQVFRARAATHEIWKPGGDTKEDLVLSRVFLLDGEEPGLNKGGKVDSRARYIYIHGTNDEARIGTPSSHGCVRLRNDDVIDLFQILPEGAPVLITE